MGASNLIFRYLLQNFTYLCIWPSTLLLSLNESATRNLIVPTRWASVVRTDPPPQKSDSSRVPMIHKDPQKGGGSYRMVQRG
jgi:hypothetical protein